MTQMAAPAAFSQESFDTFLSGRDEPEWCLAARKEAWQQFQSMDWPGRRDEEWIRTDIRLFNLDKFSLPTTGDSTPVGNGVLSKDVELGGHCITQNSVSIGSESAATLAEKGVIFGSLDQMVNEHPDLVQKYLFTSVDPTADRFAALHAAAWSGGAFLYVPKGVVLDTPVHAISLLSDGGSDFSHLLVVVEDGAEATVLTESTTENEQSQGLHCGAIELFVGEGAHLRFVNLQDWGQKVWHFARQQAEVASQGSLQWTIAALGSRLAKVNQQVALTGPDAECQVNGVMFTEHKQHLSYHTLQHHRAPHCRSDFLYKSALQDDSRTVWRGMIKVDEGAQKTDGYQRNDNLLLSSSSRADSIPGLEIEADDVRCTHGSTTSKVDEELIFYAQARGFTRKEAIRMIVTGFFQQIFDRITIESVRDALGFAIARRVRDYE